MNKRYQRQQQVPQLGAQSQETLFNARVLIVGTGGLGSPVSSLLVRAGVGKITLIDFDHVDISNLHRQSLFVEADIGLAKVSAAKQRLMAANCEVEITAIEQVLSVANAENLICQHTVVVDATDSFFASYLLSDICFKHRVPLVSASVLQTNGYVSVFCGTEEQPAPSMRAIFPSPPLSANSCNTVGVTGPSVGIIGAIQAQEVLKVILDDSTQLLGKLMYLDLWDYRQNIVAFNGAAEPKRHAVLMDVDSLSPQHILLDVRSSEEITASTKPYPHIAIPVDEIKYRYLELEKNQTIVCVCQSGQRALNAANQLLDLGFNDVRVAQ